MSWQHPRGGFAGGPGQSPHLLPTYAAVCALAIVGNPGPGGGWDEVDRCDTTHLVRLNNRLKTLFQKKALRLFHVVETTRWLISRGRAHGS
jgi:prenyltransferase beta subunit